MPKWTKQHLELLEQVFPEVTDTVCTNTLLQNTGKRTVVNYIKYLLKQQETRLDDSRRST